MTSSIDPAEAAKALDIAEAQRRSLARETRRPLWIWVALFVYIVALFAVEDFAHEAAVWVILAIAVVLWVRRLSPGFALRLNALVGLRASASRRVLPRRTQMILFVVIFGAWIGAYFLLEAHLPARVGAPMWMQEHSMAVSGLVVALVLTPAAWAVDTFTRSRITRAGGSR
jgi:hypothetical protein